jgi:hypothetical protein
MKHFSSNNGILALAPALFVRRSLATLRSSARTYSLSFLSQGQSSNYMFGRICTLSHPLPLHFPSCETNLRALADDHHVPALSSDNSSLAEHVCSLGRECFAEAFHVTTGAALLAVAVGVTLTMRKSMKRRAA